MRWMEANTLFVHAFGLDVGVAHLQYLPLKANLPVSKWAQASFAHAAVSAVKLWGLHWVGWPSWVAILLLAKLVFVDKCRGQRVPQLPCGLVPVEPLPHYQVLEITTTTPSPPPHNFVYFKPNTCCCCWLYRDVSPLDGMSILHTNMVV